MAEITHHGGNAELEPKDARARGSHLLATALGAAAGATAGATLGAGMIGPAGPIAAAIGAVLGAVAGGLAGKGIATKLEEDAYWRKRYMDRLEMGYRDCLCMSTCGDELYQPAYRYGYEAHLAHPKESWEDICGELRSGWNQHKAISILSWDEAEAACCKGWDHAGLQLDTPIAPGQGDTT